MLLLTFVMFLFGLVMVASASSGYMPCPTLNPQIGCTADVTAKTLVELGDPWRFAQKQLLWGAIGLVGLIVAMRLPMNVIREGRRVIFGGGLLLLIAVFFIGHSVNGAQRWIGTGSFSIQPSEIVKLGMVLIIADFLARYRPPDHWKQFALGPGGWAFGCAAIIYLQDDLGSAMVVAAVALAMYLVRGTPWRIMLSPVGLAFVLVAVGIATEPYRVKRFMSFLDPWGMAQEGGYQLVQAQVAIGSGGVFGTGLGHSVQKMQFLPEAHTDMIFAIIAEELGLIGAAIIIFGFAAFAIVGLRIALEARDRFQALVAVGITATICGQAVVNLGGVTSIMPLTGIPLPLVSYGGSSLVITLTSLGILANIAVSSTRTDRLTGSQRTEVAHPGGGGGNGRAPGSRTGRRRRAA